MSKGWLDRIGEALEKLAAGAARTLKREERALLRGQVAGSAVLDGEGGLIVSAGDRITDATMERAEAAGKLQALLAAVADRHLGSLRRATDAALDREGERREERNLESVEAYARARRFVGATAGVDVTDNAGTILVPVGTQITEETVRRVRDAGQLAALIYAAQATASAAVDEQRGAQEPPAVERRTVPLVTPPEE